MKKVHDSIAINDTTQAYKKVKSLGCRYQSKTTPCKNENRAIIGDKRESREKRAVEHNGNIEPLKLEAIESAIKCQRMNIASDINDIPIELIKPGSPWNMKAIHNLVLSI